MLLSPSALPGHTESMASKDTAVLVADLTKNYHNNQVLKGLSFEIAAGETYALLGPNGAGKSTTIEILEGYRSRTSGTVSVLGEDPETAGLSWKAKLGIVLQSSGENSNLLSVRESLQHFARYYPNPRDVDELLEAVGLTEKAGAKLKSLSGGQQRRIDVALGVIGRPQLLFLDEPTTGFDPKARRQFWELIRSLKREGTTILLTTHYLDEAAQLSDRVGVIAGGVLVAEDTPEQLGDSEMRIPLVEWEEAGIKQEHRTEEPGLFVAELTTRLGHEPRELSITRPTLEDIYLSLIGGATPEHSDTLEGAQS